LKLATWWQRIRPSGEDASRAFLTRPRAQQLVERAVDHRAAVVADRELAGLDGRLNAVEIRAGECHAGSMDRKGVYLLGKK